MTAVWALAGAYDASETLTYKRRSRTYDRFGVAVVEATAWSPSSSGSTPGSWNNELGLRRHKTITRPSEWHDKDDWAYVSEYYNVRYRYSEEDAYEDIDQGLFGSFVEKAAPNVWRSLEVTAIEQSVWHVGPRNSNVEAIPTTAPTAP